MKTAIPCSSASFSEHLSVSELRHELCKRVCQRALALLDDPSATQRDIKIMLDLVLKFEDQEQRARRLILAETRRAAKPKAEQKAPAKATVPEPAKAPVEASQSTATLLPFAPQPETAEAPEEADPERYMNREERRRRKFCSKAQ